MGEFTDKLDAAGSNIAGKAKELFGEGTGNAELDAQGKTPNLKGALGDKL